MQSEALNRIEDFKYQVLEEILNQCKPEQIALFHKMYPDINQLVRSKRFDWAIQQIENTLRKNNKF